MTQNDIKYTSVKQNKIIYEKYIDEKRNLFIITLLGSILPLGLSCIVGYRIGVFSFKNMFLNGDIILSLYALTVPPIINIFSVKKENDKKLTRAFVIGIILFFSQTAFYVLARYDESITLWLIILVTIIFIISSWICCCNSLKAIILYKKNNDKSESEG